MSIGSVNNTVQQDMSNPSPYFESLCNEVAGIYPGMLCYNSSAGYIKKHIDAGGFCERLFAVENPYKGGTIDTPYLQDTRVMLRTARSGDRLLVRATDATGFTPYMHLASAGDGTLAIAGVGDFVVAVSLEVAAPLANEFLMVRIF